VNPSLPLEDARHEVKFVGDAACRPILEAWIRTHAAGFLEHHPTRRVNNVYLDTHGYRAYEDNLMGASSRRKLRLRWYGDAPDPEQAALELKIRRNGLGWKVSYPVGPLHLSGVRWCEIRRAVGLRLPAEARILFEENAFPVLINTYRRRYFESSDRRVRVTLDWDQAAFDQRFGGHPNLTRRANLQDTLVVEFKFRPPARRAASEMIQGLPLRVSRNSKYVIGVATITHA
jgi:hypothetical protein